MYSYWLDKEKDKKRKFERLNKNIDVDVCIVGGGFTGLSTAYYLAKNSDLKIAVLEKDLIGEKTSGHSTAKITSQHDLFYKYLIDSKGFDFAKGYLEANEEAILEIKKIIEDEDIDCDFEITDSYVYTEDDDEVQKIETEIKAVNLIRSDLCELVGSVSLPRKIKAGIKFKNQAMFNPVKYINGLSLALEKMGVMIFDNSKVLDIRNEDGKYSVICEESEVRSDFVVLATRYPIINVPGFYFLKMYQSTSYVICADTKSDLFEGIYITSESPKISFRTIKDGDKRLLLVAGFDHKTGEEVIEEERYSNLENIVREMYPNSEIVGRWLAEDCIGLDKIPYIGEYSNIMKNFYVGTGYKKWGVTSSNIAGRIISDKILGKENKYDEIFKSTRVEPIKNSKELGNMIKQSVKSLVIDKLKVPKETIDDLKLDEGKIVEVEGRKVRNIQRY
ncbi:MAG: FAD-binding oxidoreductase [Clostridia bacterium]|nr:FAD-binding oxidoreductase [Clostridia bacterium]